LLFPPPAEAGSGASDLSPVASRVWGAAQRARRGSNRKPGSLPSIAGRSI